MASKPRRQYTEEFKREAVELIKSTGKSQAQIARELGVSDHNISRWWLEYGRAEQTDDSETVSKQAYKAMEAELRRVKEERDILKKALNIFSRSGRSAMSSSRSRQKNIRSKHYVKSCASAAAVIMPGDKANQGNEPWQMK